MRLIIYFVFQTSCAFSFVRVVNHVRVSSVASFQLARVASLEKTASLKGTKVQDFRVEKAQHLRVEKVQHLRVEKVQHFSRLEKVQHFSRLDKLHHLKGPKSAASLKRRIRQKYFICKRSFHALRTLLSIFNCKKFPYSATWALRPHRHCAGSGCC